MEFKVPDKKKFKILMPSGQSYELRKPTMKDQFDYEESLKAAQDGGSPSTKPMVAFLAKLGLPEAECLDLDSDQYMGVVQYVLGVKKS